MNRRELFGLGAWCLGGAALAQGDAGEATGWRVRIEAVRQDLAPGVQARTLAVQILARGAGHSGLEVENRCGQPLLLRSPSCDRDLSLPAGADGRCAVHGHAAAFSAAAGGQLVRGWLGADEAPATAVDAYYALPIRYWQREHGAPASCTTLGARLLVASEPIRVRDGDRVRFRFFNAGATRAVSLHLPGHAFDVLSLDGRALPRPARVAHLRVAPGEQIDTVVEMNRPGRWVLGSLSRVEQHAGFGRLVEYAGARGVPHAPVPAPVDWSYARFALPAAAVGEDPPPVHEIVCARDDWAARALRVHAGQRQRLVFYNLLAVPQLVALRGHALELRQTGDTHVRGLYKDTLALPPFARLAADVVPRQDRLELLRL